MSENHKRTYSIKAVDNALSVLEAISEEDDDFGVSCLGSKLGMDKSYIFRVLATFEQRGYVQKTEKSGRYRAGISAYETGGRFLHHLALLQKGRPIMEELAKDTGEAVYLAIPGGKDLLFLEMVDSPQQVRVMPLVGRRFPLHQFSAGKVILTHNANRDKLSSSKRSILSKGACVDHGAVGEGIGSLSVPILNAQGGACASLCLLMPEFRVSHDCIERSLLPLLKSAGEEVSAKLGHFDAELLRLCSLRN